MYAWKIVEIWNHHKQTANANPWRGWELPFSPGLNAGMCIVTRRRSRLTHSLWSGTGGCLDWQYQMSSLQTTINYVRHQPATASISYIPSTSLTKSNFKARAGVCFADDFWHGVSDLMNISTVISFQGAAKQQYSPFSHDIEPYPMLPPRPVQRSDPLLPSYELEALLMSFVLACKSLKIWTIFGWAQAEMGDTSTEVTTTKSWFRISLCDIEVAAFPAYFP